MNVICLSTPLCLRVLQCEDGSLDEGTRCYAVQGLAQELRKRLRLNLFNFDLLRPSADQPGTAPTPTHTCQCLLSCQCPWH